MMAKKQSKKTNKTMGKPLLRQVNDHAGGGFVLFAFNEEGLPEVHSNFENHVYAMACQHYIQNWSKSIEAVTIESMSHTFLDEPESDESDESGENGDESSEI